MEIDFKDWKYINGTMHKFQDGYYYDTDLNFKEWCAFVVKEYKIDDDDGFYDYLLNKNDNLNYELKQIREHMKYLFNFMIEAKNEN